MNISDFNSKNRAEMVDRIVKKRILTESSWNIENFDTEEKVKEELKRLQNEKEKHLKDDDMPSMYYENIDKHIEELNAKMDTSECDCKKVLKETKEYQQITIDDWKKEKEKKDKEDAERERWNEIRKNQKEDEEENEMIYNRNYFKKRGLAESRLPSDPSVDPQFGVPSQKKYPLFDEQHVRSAIKLFGHVDPAYERELARAIIAKMKKYNIPYNSVGPDNRLYKYIPEKFRKEE